MHLIKILHKVGNMCMASLWWVLFVVCLLYVSKKDFAILLVVVEIKEVPIQHSENCSVFYSAI